MKEPFQLPKAFLDGQHQYLVYFRRVEAQLRTDIYIHIPNAAMQQQEWEQFAGGYE